MTRMEHAPAGDAGTVTMGAVRVGNHLMLELVVYPAVLRALPWYRGGMGVTTLLSPCYAMGGNATLDVERAGVGAPYRLLARMDNPLEKLPPVQLRIPALASMQDAEHDAEPVAFRTWPTGLVLTLPSWARRMPAPPKVLDAEGVR